MGVILVVGLVLMALVCMNHRTLKSVAFTAWVFAFVAASMVWPAAFGTWFGFDLKFLIVPLIQIIMFGMGTTLSVSDFTRVLAMPWPVVVGIVLQYSVMPFVGFGLTKVFGFEPEIAAGVVLIGSAPGGVASNVINYLARCNVALSVTMTAISTLVSPVMTPLMMKLLAGRYIEVSFVKMMIDICNMILVPIVAGLVANRMLYGQEPFLRRAPALVAIAVVSIGAAVGTGLAPAGSGPAAFSANAIVDLRSFATALREPSASDGVPQFLSSRLSPQTRDLLSEYHGGVDPRLRRALVSDLNRIIQTGTVYEPGRFAGVNLSAETRNLLGQATHGADAVRLNRMLLEDAFRPALARNQGLLAALRSGLILGLILVGFVAAAKLVMDVWIRSPRDWMDRALPVVSMTAICFIIAIITARSADDLKRVGTALLGAAMLHNLLGYLLGYWGARVLRLNVVDARTVAVEVGMQNGGMASGLAMNTLHSTKAALAAAIFGPWQNVSGSILASWWRRRPVPPNAEPAGNGVEPPVPDAKPSAKPE